MSIADKLALLINTKQDIKSAISEKGVEVEGGMVTYADAIRRIESGGGSISGVDIPPGLKFSHSTISEIPQLNLGYGYEDGSYMFYNCENLVSVGDINSKGEIGSFLTTTSWMFCNCPKLKKIPKLDTRFVTNMSYMLRGCGVTGSENIEELNTSNVTDMSHMFEGCVALKTAPMLDTSNVQNMDSMFYWCLSLDRIPKYDTSKVSNMDSMFQDCRKLQWCPNLDTSNVTTMSNMFYNCFTLPSLPELNTQKVRYIDSMFYNCESIVSVPLYNFSDVRVAGYVFHNCYKLEHLEGFENLKVGLDFRSRTLLTHTSLTNVINYLYNWTTDPDNVRNEFNSSFVPTMYFGDTNLAKLTDDEISVATLKGWTVV